MYNSNYRNFKRDPTVDEQHPFPGFGDEMRKMRSLLRLFADDNTNRNADILEKLQVLKLLY